MRVSIVIVAWLLSTASSQYLDTETLEFVQNILSVQQLFMDNFIANEVNRSDALMNGINDSNQKLYETLNNMYGGKLGKAKVFANALDKALESFITRTEEKFSQSYFEVTFLNPIYVDTFGPISIEFITEINRLKDIIDLNPDAEDCWTNNSQSIFDIFNKTAVDFQQQITNYQLTESDKVKKTVLDVASEVDKVLAKIAICQKTGVTARQCLNDYVSFIRDIFHSYFSMNIFPQLPIAQTPFIAKIEAVYVTNDISNYYFAYNVKIQAVMWLAKMRTQIAAWRIKADACVRKFK